jgi:hypothetical protein
MTTWVRYLVLWLFAALALGAVFVPAHAGVQYMSGSPDLTASLEGQNEFQPGAGATLPIVIHNRGLNEVKIVQAGQVTRDDQPNTAKLAIVTLLPGEAPLTVKSDPQMVGDIPGDASVTVPFQVKFDRNAPGGAYDLPLVIQYTYLFDGEQIGFDTLINHYRNDTVTIPLRVQVKPSVIIAVSGIAAGNLTAGHEGYLSLSVTNTGSLTGKDSLARIEQSGASPVIPVDGNAYLGPFASGDTVNCTFKVRVSDQAQAAIYPLAVLVEYRDSRNDLVQSEPVIIGVPVLGKVDFSAGPGPFSVYRGDRGILEVVYANTGPVTVYSAQARLSVVDPFTAARDTAFLGDLAPGQEATARFEVSVDRTATIKEYGLDSEIRYRDALDNSLISDPLRIRIQVMPRTGIDALLSNTVLMSIVIAVLLGAAYYAYSRWKKGQAGKGEKKA